MKLFFCFLLFFFHFFSHADTLKKKNFDTLTNQLSNFLKKEHVIKNLNDSKIVIKTRSKKKLYCKTPDFSLLKSNSRTNIFNVLLICDQYRSYLKIEIHEIGKYIVAKKRILQGSTIKESDLKIVNGRLDLVPHSVYFKTQDIVNRVSKYDIYPLQPITSFMIHPVWLVKMNQEVNIIIHKNNFTIFSKAKSLSNGIYNDCIRIKTKNGTVISGFINIKGDVVIS